MYAPRERLQNLYVPRRCTSIVAIICTLSDAWNNLPTVKLEYLVVDPDFGGGRRVEELRKRLDGDDGFWEPVQGCEGELVGAKQGVRDKLTTAVMGSLGPRVGRPWRAGLVTGRVAHTS